MNLADRIASILPSGPRTTRELGDALGAHTRTMRRLCRAMARQGELSQEIQPHHTGKPGRPARRWVLVREQLALPLRPPEREATLGELVAELPAPQASDPQKAALLLLIDRARTPDELKAHLKLRTLRETFELLAALERRGLVQAVPGRRPSRRAEQLYELHPLFLVRIGHEPHHWRPDGAKI